MAKSRMVSQEIAEDSKIARLSDEAALTYAFTLPFLDRDGLCSGKPSWVGGRALQERPHIQHKAGTYIQEWVTQGLVIRYDGNDGPVLFFPGFRKHNANLPYEKEARLKFPPPPGYHRDEAGKIGLIPNDQEAAGRLAETFDTRSLYHKALTEAANNQQTLAQSLGLEDAPKIDEHKKVATYSRPTRDLISTNSTRTPIEDQEKLSITEAEVEVKENTKQTEDNAPLALAHSLMLPEWNGGDAYLEALPDKKLLIAALWLWHYQRLKMDVGAYQRNEYAEVYRPGPFVGIVNEVGFIRSQIDKADPPKLRAAHRAEFDAQLRELMR